MEDTTIIFSDTAILYLDSENGPLLARVISRAQKYTGFIFPNEDDCFSILESDGFLYRVKEIIDCNDKHWSCEQLFILSPEHVWKGESWMRSVISLDCDIVRFSRPWLPLIDLINNNHIFEL